MKPTQPNATAIITGAASGIGAAYARALHAKGWNLLLLDRNSEGMQALQVAFGTSAQCVEADLCTEHGREQAVKAMRGCEAPQAFIHCAGFGDPLSFHETALDLHLDVMTVNVQASVELTHAVIPLILPHGGSIVLVSSIAGFVEGYTGTTYSASKAFEDVLARALHRQLKPQGITVQSLCPGYTRTPIHSQAEKKAIPSCLYAQPDTVVKHSLRSLAHGRCRCIPGVSSHVIHLCMRLRAIDPVFKILIAIEGPLRRLLRHVTRI